SLPPCLILSSSSPLSHPLLLPPPLSSSSLPVIVKQEWPHNWPNFITELCKSSRTNQAICENNMRLLNLLRVERVCWMDIGNETGKEGEILRNRMLPIYQAMHAEEVFDFGRESMASKKVEYLMEQMTTQFQEVFDLCMFILQSYISNPNGIRNSLVRQTLQCLAHFLKWIPYGYIFEVYSCGGQQTTLIDLLLSHFWEPVNYRIECVKCLSEISNLVLDPSELQEFRPRLLEFMTKLTQKLRGLSSSTLNYDNPSKVAGQMRLFWETFYVQLALCLTAFLRNYRISICEIMEDTSDLFFIMKLMINMTYVNHDETFKICLDYWNLFVEVLMKEVQETYAKEGNLPRLSPTTSAVVTTESSNGTLMEPLECPEKYSSRLKVYQWVLDEVRSVVIQRMAKPQEIFLFDDFVKVYIQFDQETEEVTRDNEIDTDEIALYNEMRTILILLTNLGQDSTKRIMLEGLHVECLSPTHDASTWNPTLLNRLCYSIAAISGAMSEFVERDFLVVVIRKLLSLCEMKRGKEAKAIVASCIMHVVGQYSRFLKAHWRFLKTVAYKLFEFMHETFPGVQDMACETFLKISLKCKHVMALRHPEDSDFFLESVIASCGVQAEVLDDKQILLYFEAIAHIVSATPVSEKTSFIFALMIRSNEEWNSIMEVGKVTPEKLYDRNVAKVILKFLRINQRVAKANGAAYTTQLLYIYQDLLQVYQLYSSRIMSEVQRSGVIVIKHSEVKVLHIVKRETLHLVETYIDQAAQEGNQWKEEIVNKILSPLLMTLLEDYRDNVPTTRDHEVLSLLSVLMSRLDTHMTRALPNVFSYIFDCTVAMIKEDFRSYPDHREKFYELLKSCNKYCFDGLFALSPEYLQGYVECLVWALKHESPSVAEQGLQVTYEFVEKLMRDKKEVRFCLYETKIGEWRDIGEILGDFCDRFYYSLMQEILMVLTDRLHRAGFKYQTLILRLLLQLIEMRIVDKAETGLQKSIVMKNLITILVQSFETVNARQVEAFVLDLFNYCSGDNISKFQTHIRDFLISLKEFAGNNNELFELERNEALLRAQEKEKQRRSMIPGMTAQFDSFSSIRDIEDS
ncbi:putative exportin 1, partial [Cardiosporidium cionae]